MKNHQSNDEDEWRRKLKREVARTEQNLSTATSDLSLDSQLQRAMQCMSLSRFDEARQVLLRTKSDSSQVLLLLSISARELKNYRSVEELSRKLLATLALQDTDSRKMVFQLLGEALVRQRKITEAIKVYEDASRQCPEIRGEFEMQLGNLLAEAGDTSGAIEHFGKAALFEPKLSKESENRIRGMKNNSCRF